MSPKKHVPPPLRILVVEDNGVVRRLMEQLLAIEGYEVVAADDGRAGLAAFKAGRFDAVVTDHLMPGMTGLEMAVAIKEIAPRMPIAMVSAYLEMAPDGELPRVIDSLLCKPFKPAALFATVREVLARGQAGPIK